MAKVIYVNLFISTNNNVTSHKL